MIVRQGNFAPAGRIVEKCLDQDLLKDLQRR